MTPNLPFLPPSIAVRQTTPSPRTLLPNPLAKFPLPTPMERRLIRNPPSPSTASRRTLPFLPPTRTARTVDTSPPHLPSPATRSSRSRFSRRRRRTRQCRIRRTNGGKRVHHRGRVRFGVVSWAKRSGVEISGRSTSVRFQHSVRIKVAEGPSPNRSPPRRSTTDRSSKESLRVVHRPSCRSQHRTTTTPTRSSPPTTPTNSRNSSLGTDSTIQERRRCDLLNPSLRTTWNSLPSSRHNKLGSNNSSNNCKSPLRHPIRNPDLGVSVQSSDPTPLGRHRYPLRLRIR